MVFKEIATEMYDQISSMIECVDLLYLGMLNNNLKATEDARRLVEPLGKRAGELTEELAGAGSDDPSAAPYASVPSHVGAMADAVTSVAKALERKTAESVLFSDMAVSELEYLLERIRDMFMHTRDMVLARNRLVARHLAESQKAIERTAADYATRHEERLIGGLCAPKASGIFLEILDSIKVIAWHAREIAKDLG